MLDKELVDTYNYGTMKFTQGTKLPILEHVDCPSSEGKVVKNNKTIEPSFVLACVKCLRGGMIPHLSS